MEMETDTENGKGCQSCLLHVYAGMGMRIIIL